MRATGETIDPCATAAQSLALSPVSRRISLRDSTANCFAPRTISTVSRRHFGRQRRYSHVDRPGKRDLREGWRNRRMATGCSPAINCVTLHWRRVTNSLGDYRPSGRNGRRQRGASAGHGRTAAAMDYPIANRRLSCQDRRLGAEYSRIERLCSAAGPDVGGCGPDQLGDGQSFADRLAPPSTRDRRVPAGRRNPLVLPSKLGPATEIRIPETRSGGRRTDESEQQMSEALDSQRKLVREVHHRVKTIFR